MEEIDEIFAIAENGEAAVDTPVALVYCPDRAFLAPYIRRAFGGEKRVIVVDCLPESMPERAKAAVMISSAEIYAVSEGRNIDESAPLDETSVWYGREEPFCVLCRDAGVPFAILRCAHVVGTGMTGFPMWLAAGINAGWMVHVKGNEAAVSVVHAIDVAAIAALVVSGLAEGRAFEPMNVTDGTATSVDDLVDALAFRINDKRVWTLGGFMARATAYFYDKVRYAEMTTTRTFDDARQIAATEGMKLHVVTEYLRTHDYTADDI